MPEVGVAEGIQLPRLGVSSAEIFEDLARYKELDPQLDRTYMSIGTNFGKDEIHEVLNGAHAMFAHENNMVVFARPGSKIVEDELLAFCASILSGGVTGVVATISSGGTESIFNAVHAARERARALHPEITRPKWIASFNAHGALTKACHYLDIELVRVPDRDFRADVDRMAELVDDDTIGIYASAPNFPFGVYDDIQRLGHIGQEHDLWLHVDACVGGFLAPFAELNGEPIPPWDFRVPGVMSMSADIHKYGYGLKPASVTVWRSRELLKYHHVVVSDWPMGTYVTPGFVGSRSGGPIAAAWAVMRHLGVEGYCEMARETFRLRDRLLAGLADIPGIEVPIAHPELSIIVFRGTHVSLDALVGGMQERGWVHFTVHDPELAMLVVDPAAGAVVEEYLSDLREVVAMLEAGGTTSVSVAHTYAGEI